MKSLNSTRRKPLLITVVAGLLIAGTCPFWMPGGKPDIAPAAPLARQAPVAAPTPPVISESSMGPGLPNRVPHSEDNDRMVRLREFGRSGDHRYVAELVSELNNSPYVGARITALNALGRMGATEALPAVEAYSCNPQDEMIGSKAVAARARMLAESSTRGTKDAPTRAAAKVERFYREIGVSAAQMNAAALEEEQMERVIYGPQPVEIEAMRELADMVYDGPYSAYASLLGITHVDFSHDYPSRLKMQLAPLSREQRIAWLIEDLSHRRTLNNETPFEERLLADEGLPASNAAAAKLREMDTHPDDYPDMGFGALFEAIGGVGDKTQFPLVDHIGREPRPGHNDVGLAAGNVLGDLKKGVRRGLIPWY